LRICFNAPRRALAENSWIVGSQDSTCTRALDPEILLREQLTSLNDRGGDY
jgi:hypothetical protein